MPGGVYLDMMPVGEYCDEAAASGDMGGDGPKTGEYVDPPPIAEVGA